MSKVYIKGIQVATPDMITGGNEPGGTSGGTFNYLGHFPSFEDLPMDGQPSGITGSSPRTFTTDPTLNTSIDIPVNTLYPYIFGVVNGATTYLYVATNFPETIKSMAYGSDGSYEIYCDASVDKPVAVYYGRGTGITGAYVIPDSQKDDYYVVKNNQKTSNGVEMTEPFTLTGYIGGYGSARIFGNIPNVIAYHEHGYYAYARNSTGSGNTYTEIGDAMSNSLTLAFKDGYTYNVGMKMLTFDENYNATWIMDECSIKENDMASVGNENIVYIANSQPKWERWGGGYSRHEIDMMINAIYQELAILNPEIVIPDIPDVG